MKVWNKETRNEQGKFYRDKSHWGVDVADDFGKRNFTTVEPPDGKCDWDEEAQAWIVDDTLTDEELMAKREKITASAPRILDAMLEFFALWEDAGKPLPSKLKTVVDKWREFTPIEDES